MTFQITPDECNRLIRSYQTDAANRPRVLTSDAEEKELLDAWRARIQALAQHAAFLCAQTAGCGSSFEQKFNTKPLTKKMVIEMYEPGDKMEQVQSVIGDVDMRPRLVPTGDSVRVGTEDKPKSLFQRGISARVLQGVKLCDKCMRQLPQCVCHQSNVRGE